MTIKANPSTTNLYAILGVSKIATKAEIREAYKKRAKIVHPDKKGGSAEAFKALNNAFNILSDDEKRWEYDNNQAYSHPNHNEPVMHDLANLATLIRSDNINAIMHLIKQIKIERGTAWHFSQENYLECAFRDAILLERHAIIKLLIDEGIDVNGKADISDRGDKRPFLYFAICSGQLNIVKLLVQHHAKLNDELDIYINAGIERGFTEIVKYFFESGQPSLVNNAVSIRNSTFLVNAARHSQVQTLDLLFQYIPTSAILSAMSLAYKKYPRDYENIVRKLMDHAVGIDFSLESNFFELLHQLPSIANINFIGVSVGGHPITHQRLLAEGLAGAEKAIISSDDLAKMNDPTRHELLSRAANLAIKKYGLLVVNGALNLISLSTAAEVGDLDAVVTRLKIGMDPNISIDSSGISVYPIVLAAKNGHDNVVFTLLSHPNFNKASLSAAIDVARENHHESLAAAMLQIQHINDIDTDGNAAIHLAVANGNPVEVFNLISKGANINSVGCNGYPLEIAAAKTYDRINHEPVSSYIEVLRILLANGANPNLFYENSPLKNAAMAGSVEAFAMLLPLTVKEDILISNDRTDEITHYPWYTDIMYSAVGSWESIEIFKLLKAQGTDFNQINPSNNDTLLHCIMRNMPSLSAIYCKLIDNSSYNVAFDDYLFEDPLPIKDRSSFQSYQRTFFYYLNCIDYLLENGIDPNIKEKQYHETALHLLLKNIDLHNITGVYAKIIDKFLSKGFDINTADRTGMTLLHVAVSQHNIAAVKYLLARNANINSEDYMGRTPLFYLMTTDLSIEPSHLRPDIAALLLSNGANPDILDHQGLTPLCFLQQKAESWMKTATYLRWSPEVQQTWHQSVQLVQKHLCKESIRPTLTKSNNFSQALLNYVNDFNHRPSMNVFFSSLNLSNFDRMLLGNYVDDFSCEIMEIPVMLNERIYDFKTLWKLLETTGRDPVTNEPIFKGEITPALTVARDINLLSQFFRRKYYASQSWFAKEANYFSIFSQTPVSQDHACHRTNENLSAPKMQVG